jgi:hypothetical protein
MRLPPASALKAVNVLWKSFFGVKFVYLEYGLKPEKSTFFLKTD